VPATAFPFDYRLSEPEGDAARLVESVWYARGTVPYTRERIAPTGSSVAVFVLGDPILQTPERGDPLEAAEGFLIGPHDRPVWNEPRGETFALGIVARPSACRALFGVAPADLRGRVAPLLDAWTAAEDLRARLVSASQPEAMLDCLSNHIASCAVPETAGFERCERAVMLLEAEPARPIAEIADELEVSHAHLDRQFTETVGLTPRSLARLLRMRRLLEQLDVRENADWAGLAVEHGWYDQGHFIRDFKRHTGVTPTQYVDSQRRNFAPDQAGDGAGFVPEG
jgi:AraC-like DNA-binding protein